MFVLVGRRDMSPADAAIRGAPDALRIGIPLRLREPRGARAGRAAGLHKERIKRYAAIRGNANRGPAHAAIDGFGDAGISMKSREQMLAVVRIDIERIHIVGKIIVAGCSTGRRVVHRVGNPAHTAINTFPHAGRGIAGGGPQGGRCGRIAAGIRVDCRGPEFAAVECGAIAAGVDLGPRQAVVGGFPDTLIASKCVQIARPRWIGEYILQSVVIVVERRSDQIDCCGRDVGPAERRGCMRADRRQSAKKHRAEK